MLPTFEYVEILRAVFTKNAEKQTSWGKEQVKVMFMESIIEANNIMLREWYKRHKGEE